MASKKPAGAVGSGQEPAPPLPPHPSPSPDDVLLGTIRALYGSAPAAVTIEFLDGRRVVLRRRRHSADFSAVVWDGVPYFFTENQAAAVAFLWQQAEQGTPDVRLLTIFERAGSAQVGDDESDEPRGGPRLMITNLFRDGSADHPALGTMIVKGRRKGTWRLAD